jgi:hypothetical protein
LLPPRKGKYLRRRPDLNTEPCHGLTGETVHLWFVEDPKLSQETWPEKFSPEEDVSGGGQIGREGQVLIDRLDPGCARILWPAEMDDFAIDPDLTFVWTIGAGKNPDQGAFPGTVIADQTNDLTPTNRKIGTSQRLDMTKMPDNAPSFDERCVWHQISFTNWSARVESVR